MSGGKQLWGSGLGQLPPPPVGSSQSIEEIVVTPVRSDSIITRKIGGVIIETMFDSGFYRSLICKANVIGMTDTSRTSLPNLVTASRQPLPMIDHIEAKVQIGQLKVRHNILVVEGLVTPAIL